MVDSKRIEGDYNMEINELVKICKEAENIICYGAGYNARDLTCLFKENNMEIAAYCVSNPSENIETYYNKPLIGVKDIKNYSNALVVVGVSSKYHDEIRENLEREEIKNAVFIDDDMTLCIRDENVKTGWRARGYILFNSPLNHKELEKFNQDYEDRIEKIKKKFSHIEIKYTTGYSIAALIEQFCYYSDMKYNGDAFLLLYPTGCLPDGKTYSRKFTHTNEFILQSFKGDFYEVVSNKNLMFWKYFIKNYPGMFVDKLDNKFWIKYKKNRLEDARNGSMGILGKRYIEFNEEEEAEGKKILAKWNVSFPYICFNSRDSAYTRDEFKYKDLYYDWADEFRNSDVNNYRLLCEKFQEMGISTVRVGSKVDTEINFPGCVDYANKFRSPFMDAYINAKSEFIIGDASGVQSFASLFNKPIVMTNCVQVGTLFIDPINPIFYERDLLIMKKLWSPKLNRYLTMREIIEYEHNSIKNGVEFRFLWELYHEEGIVPIQNTPEEILDVALEMYGRTNGTYEYDSLDEDLQKRYVEIAREANTDENWYWIPVRMGAKFLRQNQWLLE